MNGVSKTGLTSGQYLHNYIRQAYQINAGVIPMAKRPINDKGEGMSDRISALYRDLGLKVQKEKLPESEISSILATELNIKDTKAAWEHYLRNFNDLNNVTTKLEALGFENPFLDRDGKLEELAISFRESNDELEKVIDIIRTILRKRDKFPKAYAVPQEYWKEAIHNMVNNIKPELKQNITYDITKARPDGVQTPGDILESYYAQCFEYSCLFFSLAKKSGLNAGIVFTPGHAFNWVEMKGSKYDIDLTREYEYYRRKNRLQIEAVTDEIQLQKLKARPASAEEIFFMYHRTKGFMLMKQGHFDEAERMFKIAYGINPEDLAVNAGIESLGRDILIKNNIDDQKAVQFVESNILLGSKDKVVIEELYNQYYSVRQHIRALKELSSSVDFEA